MVLQERCQVEVILTMSCTSHPSATKSVVSANTSVVMPLHIVLFKIDNAPALMDLNIPEEAILDLATPTEGAPKNPKLPAHKFISPVDGICSRYYP